MGCGATNFPAAVLRDLFAVGDEEMLSLSRYPTSPVLNQPSSENFGVDSEDLKYPA